MLIVRRPKLYYTTSGNITPIGVMITEGNITPIGVMIQEVVQYNFGLLTMTT